MENRAKNVSIDDFLNFLQGIGLSETTMDNAREMNLTAAILLLAMNHDDQLDDIGIDNPYLRMKFRVLFKRYLLQKTSPIAETFTVAAVTDFCRKNKMIAKCAEVCAYKNTLILNL